MEVFFTVLAGAGAFSLGQVVLKLLIEPVHSLKSTIAEISHCLSLYANVYANPQPPGDDRQREASNVFRTLASDLRAKAHLVPGYRVTARVFGLPNRAGVDAAAKHLIFLHNGHDGALANQGILNCYAAQHTRVGLNIYIQEGEWLNPDHENEFVRANCD